jgi:predicted phage terminase large subunit-like protein
MIADNVRRAALVRERSRAIAVEGDVRRPDYSWAFTTTYLKPYVTHPESRLIVPPAGFHADLDQLLFGTFGTGARTAIAAPRGHGKSTKASLIVPLICLARELKQYILLIQNTHAQAKQAMSQIIHELDNNELLLADFPGLRRAYVNGRPVADRDDDVALANGCRLQALGAGGSLRGRRNRQTRVDLAILDDVEDDNAVLTQARRDQLDTWVSSALLGALAPKADVYVVGSILHHDAVLVRLQKRDGWSGYQYNAAEDPDDLSTSCWPAWWGKSRLEEARRAMGTAVFNREFMNRPIDPGTAIFRREDFQYDTSRRRLLEAAKGEIRGVRLRIGVDPAVSEKTTADYSAISVVAQIGASPDLHVLDVVRGRWSAHRLTERIAAEVARWSAYSPIVITESVAFSSWLYQGLKERGIAARQTTPQRDKVTRAAPLGVRYENRQVIHDVQLRDSPFETELEQFPASRFDDQVDSLVIAAGDLATTSQPRITRL